MSAARAIGAVAANRERGLSGEVWFYEKGFVANDAALAKALAAGPYRVRARLPWRDAPGWRPGELIATTSDEGGERTWSVTPPSDGVYTVWVQEKGAPEGVDAATSAPGPGWRVLTTKRLVAGRVNELVRTRVEDAEDVVSVKAMIDRRADRN